MRVMAMNRRKGEAVSLSLGERVGVRASVNIIF
jgi:hypothetical protein